MNAKYCELFHVVLVEPGESLNVGSVARAMMNLGFSNLHLVAPVGYQPQKAHITACWAKDIVDRAILHDSYESALSSMEHVVGFSAREGQNRGGKSDLVPWALSLRGRALPKTALVFGPEDNGLRAEHVNLCRSIVRIPSTEEFPSFNLSQAVLLALYEITRNLTEESNAAPSESMPTGNDFVQLDRLVGSVLEKCGFFREGTPEPVPGLVKHLFRRIDPNEREMKILLGLFGRLERTFDKLS